jgi:hypothetical protein
VSDENALLEIDVEGHEKAVLLGAAQTIRTQHPTIFIEIWDHNKSKVVSIIEGFGYSSREIPSGRMDFRGQRLLRVGGARRRDTLADG